MQTDITSSQETHDMNQVLNALKTFFLQDESGQGLVEYALLISLVALAVV